MIPRRRKAEDTDVFTAKVWVLLRVGPAELTLGAIAAEAGVTAGALVQRFGSKRLLWRAHARYAAPPVKTHGVERAG
jgi:AcrR family transcriptional regulator